MLTPLTLWFVLLVSFAGLPVLLALVFHALDAWEHRTHPLDYDGYCVRCIERRLQARRKEEGKA